MKELLRKMIKDNKELEEKLIEDGLLIKAENKKASINITCTEEGRIKRELKGHPITLLVILNETIEIIKKEIDMTDEEYEILLNSVIYKEGDE